VTDLKDRLTSRLLNTLISASSFIKDDKWSIGETIVYTVNKFVIENNDEVVSIFENDICLVPKDSVISKAILASTQEATRKYYDYIGKKPMHEDDR